MPSIPAQPPVMHPFHDYIVGLLATKIRARRVVVWYDERAEFADFVNELRGGPRIDAGPVIVKIADEDVHLVEVAGSMFEVRFAVEPLVSGDMPAAVLVYVPSHKRDESTSVLLELELAGECIHAWRLHQLAHNYLRRTQTAGIVDELLKPGRRLGYADLAALASDQTSRGPSVLRGILKSRDDGELLAAWCASEAYDQEITEKGATGELVALVRSVLGLELPAGADLPRLRSHTLRYVLGGEFRADLAGPAPSTLDSIPVPPTTQDEGAVRLLAQRLRQDHREVYPVLADRIEKELRLAEATISPSALGSIDTFQFEERVLLRHCGDLVSDGRYDEALAIVGQREHSFWLDIDGARKAQWEAVRRMAQLGRTAVDVRSAMTKANGDVKAWVDRYTAADGWHLLDRAQRRLEAWLTELEEDWDRPLGLVRRAYEDTCQAMAEGFTQTLVAAGWTVPGVLHQTGIFSEVVAREPKPVAYFFVDAMRFEMGVELAERLPATSEVAVRPAIAALPSITAVGMAALHPGAAESFNVVEHGGTLGAEIDGAFLPGLPARQRFAASRIPGLVDLTLNELLSMSTRRLKEKVEAAEVVIVRSQEVDHAGEAGFTFTARKIMDAVIGNVALAVRRLTTAGIARAVITADHGHLFVAADRDESMRVEAPGGQTIDLHRRCWVGRGGSNPPGSVRVRASALGYASDLDFVFPPGASVFRAGGDLAFHHGGPTLQELVVPVVTVRTVATPTGTGTLAPVEVTEVPAAVTNRIFSVSLMLGGLLAQAMTVRPVLMSRGAQVGTVGMVDGGEFDPGTGDVRMEPGRPVSVWFRLTGDDVAHLRVVVLDPGTDAELYRSPGDIPVRLAI